MIVDAHVHTHWSDPDRRPDEILDLMHTAAKRNGIEKQIIAGSGGFSAGTWDEKKVHDSNTATQRAVAESPEALLACCTMNPANATSFIREEAERCLGEGDMVGIKLHVHVNARDRRLDPVMELAAQYDAPVIYHCWYKSVDQKPNESTPADIADLARRHPGVSIVMAHLIGCGARGVLDVRALPNVYVDTSGSQPESVTTEYAVKQLGVERVIYGSDFPGRDYATQMARITGADLTQWEKEQILGGNAVQLFKIPA